jgi:hypothetical protein
MNPGSDVRWQDYEHKDQLISWAVGEELVSMKYWRRLSRHGDRINHAGRMVLVDEEFWNLVGLHRQVELATEGPEKPTMPTKEST